MVLAPAIISNVLLASAIALVAMLVGWSGRRAGLAHALWVVVFIKLVTPPIMIAPIGLSEDWSNRMVVAQRWLQPVVVEPESPVLMDSGSNRVTAAGLISRDHQPSASQANRSWRLLTHGLIAIWVSGTIFSVFRGLRRTLRFSRLLRDEGVVDPDAAKMIAELLENQSSSRSGPVVIRISAHVSPMLFGLGRRAKIVCPNSLWFSLEDSHRRSFLAHELAHYQRGDHWIRLLEWLVTAIYWWLPLVYLARHQLERHEEVACDARAVRYLSNSRRTYAETLLNVVDYLNDSRPATPRLASRMQATQSLEERIRMIMSADAGIHSSMLTAACVWVLCIASLLVHPRLNARDVEELRTLDDLEITDSQALTSSELPSFGSSEQWVTGSLPPAPAGWWNSAPPRVWMDHRVSENELRMLARAGIGIGIIQPGAEIEFFQPHDVRGIVYIAANGRLVIGNAAGELHLWDTAARASVSLIGKHGGAVSSVCYHAEAGLISGDQTGQLSHWELNSGRILGNQTFDGPIAAVRWSSDGEQLAVLVGDWKTPQSEASLHFVDGKTLTIIRSLKLPNEIALATQIPGTGWVVVDWTGLVRSLDDGQVVTRIDKNMVSGLVLCQDIAW